jgi:hypothetical protein
MKMAGANSLKLKLMMNVLLEPRKCLKSSKRCMNKIRGKPYWQYLMVDI